MEWSELDLYNRGCGVTVWIDGWMTNIPWEPIDHIPQRFGQSLRLMSNVSIEIWRNGVVEL